MDEKETNPEPKTEGQQTEEQQTKHAAKPFIRSTPAAKPVHATDPYTPPEKEGKKKGKKAKPEEPEREILRFQPLIQHGLNSNQVASRMAEGLSNAAPKKYSKTYRKIITDNLFTFFNLLCVLCAVALALANADVSQFLFVPIFLGNIAIGLFQEIRSKIKIDKLTILTQAHTTVIRNCKRLSVPTNEIVLDDIILLETGQQVPADCILLQSTVEVNESLLTGESVAIKKEPGDMLYAGSFITAGHGTLRVDKIGKDTYISRLTSEAKQYKKPKSEIMNSVTLFIRIIAILLVPIAAGMYYRNWMALCVPFIEKFDAAALRLGLDLELSRWQVFRFGFNLDLDSLQAFAGMFGESLPYADGEAFCQACRSVFNESVQRTASVVIGMIPSGLLLLTSLALAVGVFRLAQHNTLVQDLYSLEMLARVNVLCLDKTGTITDGQMKVHCVEDICLPQNLTTKQILGSMLSVLPDNNQTSIALHSHFGYDSVLTMKTMLPFSSARKFSAVTFKDGGTYAIGAPEFILKPVPASVEKRIGYYAQRGLRVILLARSNGEITEDAAPDGFEAVALIALEDNIRADAIETIRWFTENDVQIKVISGDNPITVAEVARRAGVPNANKYISLEGLSPLEVENVACDYTVFGRVTPEQKAILVRQIKASGDTVAMTGDGVNDILAMKEADCAISIASGSEASRNVSNIVLLDNNFASMPKVVFEGRRVINNVKNSASLYLMKTFLTALLAIFCLLTGTTYFFKTSNLLLFEMFIAGVPSVFLSLQPNTERVHGKFITHVISRAVPGAVTMALSVIAMYLMSTPLFANLLNMGGLNEIFLSTEEEAISVADFLARQFQTDYLALAFVALTYSGTVMLYRLCQPFNIMRGTLWASSISICTIGILFLPDFFFSGWSELSFTFPEILYLLLIVLVAFPLSKGLIRFFDKLGNRE
ncbi:MAG: HAD-IC family P-type ATPase [Christensenellaceae bacterium]